MAGNKISPEIKRLQEMKSSELKTVEFTNSRGLKVKLLPLSPYLLQMAVESVQRPEVPTYSIITADGTEEIHAHDQESISQSSDEDKEKWKKYAQGLKEAEVQASNIILNVILMEGVDLENVDMDRWRNRQRLMGIPVPEDEEEQLLMYKKQQVIGDAEDIEKIIKLVLSITGVSQEEVNLAKQSFPNKVESKESTGEGNKSKGS